MKKGYTLVELLMVIGIIGILAGLLITVLNPLTQIQKARDAKRKADLQQIGAALEQYRADKGTYPKILNQNYVVACATPFTDGGTTTYTQNFPCDPLGTSSQYNGGNYMYVGTSGNTYVLVACLENASDTQGTPLANLPAGVPAPGNTCKSNIFYVVANP